uniref:52 kDa repressor of the inhibitor of the protein kinaselike [Acyrthosiphon pisum] n=1 Tax=Lepeophtheirus salmonis TaxID=72036 RepID=A0A0K2VDU6_LEPSM
MNFNKSIKIKKEEVVNRFVQKQPWILFCSFYRKLE